MGLLCSGPGLAARPDASVTAFVGVNVIPMDRDRVVPDQTVLVQSGRILALGSRTAVQVPPGAQVLDGRGRFLLPGLADMHVHLDYSSDPAHLGLYLANGVTTVRNFNALPQHYAWQRAVASGELFGPRIVTSGPGILGLPPGDGVLADAGAICVLIAGLLTWVTWWTARWVLGARRELQPGQLATKQVDEGDARGRGGGSRLGRTQRRRTNWGVTLLWAALTLLVAGLTQAYRLLPTRLFLEHPQRHFVFSSREARWEVDRQVRDRHDFLKLHAFLPPGTFLAALEQARRDGFYTVAHLPDQAAPQLLDRAYAAGLDEVAHVEEFDAFTSADASDRASLTRVARQTRRAGVRVTTTLATVNAIAALYADPAGELARPIYRVVPPQVKAAWLTGERLSGRWPAPERAARLAWYRAMTRALSAAGVPLLAGTDVGVEGVVPGASLHRELELLVEAGLSPYQALVAATREPSRTIGAMTGTDDAGLIAPGRRADLLLLEANPLQDIRRTQQRVGVMVAGRWFSQAALDARVAAYVAHFIPVGR